MAVKRINIQKLIETAREYKDATEDEIPRVWSKRELVEIIIYVIESFKK